MVGTGHGAELGVLFKSGEALQAMAYADTVVLDKTGTVTEGKPRLMSIYSAALPDNELLSICAAAESGSEHPVAKAIVEAAVERGINIPAAENTKAIPGRGIRAAVAGRELLIGSDWASEAPYRFLRKTKKRMDEAFETVMAASAHLLGK